MILMRGIAFKRGIGRVVLKVEPVLGPGIARAYRGGKVYITTRHPPPQTKEVRLKTETY